MTFSSCTVQISRWLLQGTSKILYGLPLAKVYTFDWSWNTSQSSLVSLINGEIMKIAHGDKLLTASHQYNFWLPCARTIPLGIYCGTMSRQENWDIPRFIWGGCQTPKYMFNRKFTYDWKYSRKLPLDPCMVPPVSTPHNLSAAKRKRRIRTPSWWIHYEMRWYSK